MNPGVHTHAWSIQWITGCTKCINFTLLYAHCMTTRNSLSHGFLAFPHWSTNIYCLTYEPRCTGAWSIQWITGCTIVTFTLLVAVCSPLVISTSLNKNKKSKNTFLKLCSYIGITISNGGVEGGYGRRLDGCHHVDIQTFKYRGLCNSMIQ